MFFSALFFVNGALANPVNISVTDPMVSELVFDCDGATKRSPVKNGMASLAEIPGECDVYFIKKIGKIDGAGTYSCSPGGCQLDEVHHKPISDAPGRINIILTSKVDSPMMEVNCPSGHRVRTNVETNTAIFNSVPDEDCALLFKGGMPAQYRPIRAGTYYCSLSGGTAICNQR